jgi:hypothetical protein
LKILNLNNITIENTWKDVMLLSRLAKMPFEHIANVYVEDGA